MSITNLQQARQMYAMGQRVAKTLDGSRPGYRGPGGYQGGASSRGGPPGGGATAGGSGRDFSPGPSNTGGAGKQNTGNARDDYRANYSSKSIVKGGGTKKPGGGYNDVRVTGDKGRSARRDFIQTLNNNNAIRANQTGTKFTSYQGGSRPKPRSGLGSLIMGALGMLMGIPGLGLLTGGIRNLGGGLKDLNRKFRGVNPDGTTRTQAQYEKARFDRQQVNRLDKLFAAKDRGYNQIGFGDFTKKTVDFTPGQQAKIDQLMAAGYMPSTARNVDSGRGSDLRGILSLDNLDSNKIEASDLNNISSLIAAADQGLLEAPGDNLSVVPNRNINYNTIQEYTDQYPNLGMEEIVESNTIPTINGVPMINTGSVYDNLNKNSYTYPADTTVQNTVPVSNYDVRDDFYTGDRLTEFAMENGVITKNDQRLVAPFRLAKGGIASL